MAGSDIPLLNHYKKEFVYKRLPQTFFGGPSLKLGYPAPCYVYLLQILLWLTPFVIGGAFTLAVEVGQLQPLHAAIGNGAVLGVLSLLIQLASKLVAGRQSRSAKDKRSISSTTSINSNRVGRLLAEEDEVAFEKCWSSTTLLFVVPPKRYYFSIIMGTILSTFINGAGMWYCLPYTTFVSVHGYDIVGGVFLYIFSWTAICVGHYPLLIGNPVPETATYRSVDFYETQNFSRALHISLFFIVFIVDIVVESTTLTDFNNVLHIIFCTLPLLWLFGVIPPFDALILWSTEQFLIFGFGGSSMSTDWRLLFMVVVSSVVLTGLCFLTSTQAIIACSVGFGYILSTNITSIVFDAVSRIRKAVKETTRSDTKVKEFDKDLRSSGETVSKSLFSWKFLAFHCAMFSLAFVATFLAHFYLSNDTVRIVLEYVFIATFVVMVACKELQRVFIIFGFFRNCVYPTFTLSQAHFAKRKKILRAFGITHSAFMHFVFPVLSSIYLSFNLFTKSTIVLPAFEAALGCMFSLRFVWQCPGNAHFSFMLLSILNLIPSLQPTMWGALFLGTRLIIINVCRDRFFQFLQNLWFAVALTATSWTDKKQRRSKTIPIICLNAIFFPLTLVIIATSMVLSAPLLPVFTLPIFLVGFPRPSRFWPSQPGSMQANVGPDTIYYQELVEPTSNWFSSEISLGIVDAQYSSSFTSPFYIARSQDRTLWIQVLESGYGYASLIIKGLELQETSCHALEATRLDDAFDIAFEKAELDLRCLRTNRYGLSSVVTPVDSAFVDGHSDAKTSLKGIIDHPDTMQQLRTDFLKCLSWLLSDYIISQHKTLPPLNEALETFIVPDNSSTELRNGGSFAELPNAVVPDDPKILPSRADSLVSFTSLLSSGDELSTSRKNKRNQISNGQIELEDRSSRGGRRSRQSKNRMKTGKKEADVDDWDLDSILSDSGFGLPVVESDVIKKGKNEAVIKKSALGSRTSEWLKESYIYLYNESDLSNKNGASVASLIPSKWNEIPVSLDDISSAKKLLDMNWLEECLKVAMEKSGHNLSLLTSALTPLKDLILSCDAIVNIMGIPGKDYSLLGKDHLRQVYNDSIPWSPALDWLKSRKDLYGIVVKAYRYSVKLMYDQVSLGPVENFSELKEYLDEYDSDWFIGVQSDPEWIKKLVDGNSHLFALCYHSATKEISTRILYKQSVSFHLGRVNPSAVRGIWANFALELIYATNDDEERYSIQAHLALLRNLIVQTVDPPLGYPIFSSHPLQISTLPF